MRSNIRRLRSRHEFVWDACLAVKAFGIKQGLQPMWKDVAPAGSHGLSQVGGASCAATSRRLVLVQSDELLLPGMIRTH